MLNSSTSIFYVHVYGLKTKIEEATRVPFHKNFFHYSFKFDCENDKEFSNLIPLRRILSKCWGHGKCIIHPVQVSCVVIVHPSFKNI
jgi:hypothetical protein